LVLLLNEFLPDLKVNVAGPKRRSSWFMHRDSEKLDLRATGK